MYMYEIGSTKRHWVLSGGDTVYDISYRIPVCKWVEDAEDDLIDGADVSYETLNKAAMRSMCGGCNYELIHLLGTHCEYLMREAP